MTNKQTKIPQLLIFPGVYTKTQKLEYEKWNVSIKKYSFYLNPSKKKLTIIFMLQFMQMSQFVVSFLLFEFSKTFLLKIDCLSTL
jgi:hypothetical protein